MSKVRKALIAAVTAAGATLWAGLQGDTPDNEAEWAGLIGTVIAAGAVAGWAVWRVPNAPTPTPERTFRERGY